MVGKIVYILLLLEISHAWVPAMEKGHHFQGDIVLTPDQEIEARKGNFTYGSVTIRLWPKTIAVEFGPKIQASERAKKRHLSKIFENTHASISSGGTSIIKITFTSTKGLDATLL